MFFTEAFSFFDSIFSAVAMVVSFCPHRRVLSGTLPFMDALIDARACEAGFNFLPGWCRHRVLTVAAIKANWAQAVTRLQAIASLRVAGMQLSGNQMAARSVEVQRVTAETAG
jgi:hypothetical protein